MTATRRRPPKSTPAQPSFDSLPSADPAPYIVWSTKKPGSGKRRDSETPEHYQTVCKGHRFRVRPLPQFAGTPHLHWELSAQFELHRDELEFMSSLPFCKTKQEALTLAEERIRGFIQHQRRHYA